MSCDDFIYTPHGRQGIGVIQPQSGLDYPFVNPSDDIRYLVADFYLAFDDNRVYAAALPLSIKYLYNVGCGPNDLPPSGPAPVHDADIVVVDKNGVEVLNTCTGSGVVLTTRDWNTDYKIYEWVAPNAVCRLVAYTTWRTGEPTPVNYVQYLAPQSALLDARTVYRMPKRLRSLSVRQNSGTTTIGPYVGKIRFRNNYNVEISAADTTTSAFVTTTRVNFSAEPGSGAGYFPVCGDGYDEETQEPIPQPIKQINGVAANSAGDFLLAGSDCIYVRRPTAVVAGQLVPHPTAQQQVGADCVPCCACADYVSTALYMNQIRDKYKLIGTRANEVKNIHEENITKWRDKRNCAINNPLKLVMVPQCCPFMDIVTMICNPCTVCYPPSTLILTLETRVNVGLSLVCRETTLYGSGGTSAQPVLSTARVGNVTTITIPMLAVPGGSASYIKMRVRAEDSDAIAAGPTITGTLTGLFAPQSPILVGCDADVPAVPRAAAVATKTTSFNCSVAGTDTQPCPTSTTTV